MLRRRVGIVVRPGSSSDTSGVTEYSRPDVVHVMLLVTRAAWNIAI